MRMIIIIIIIIMVRMEIKRGPKKGLRRLRERCWNKLYHHLARILDLFISTEYMSKIL